MARFVLDLGKHQVQLAVGAWRIGRDANCEIRLDDEAVSRRHATLRVSADAVELLDHGSRNGVRVNGERVYGRKVVRVGDVITIGAAELRLIEAEDIPTAQISAPTKPLPKAPPPGAATPLEQLSKREREVFTRVARGQTAREVAAALGLSVKTVESYRARIAEKLGVRTRADLVQLALQTGVLRPE